MSSVSVAPLLGVADTSAVERTLQRATPEESAKAAAQQFEALLVRQMLGTALKPMFGSSLEGNAPGSDVYQYLVTDVVAQSVAQGGGLGIAKMLLPQLTPRTSTSESQPQ